MYNMRLLTVAVVFVAITNGHCDRLGFCPDINPMQEFEMSKFLGTWHVIQTTPLLGEQSGENFSGWHLSEKSSVDMNCITYNYTQGKKPSKFIFTIGEESHFGSQYHYTETLSVLPPSSPALMFMNRPSYHAPSHLNGGMSHTVFATDYVNYAGIFFCETYLVGPLHRYAVKRHSAMILSRQKSLDKEHLDLLHQKLSSFGIDSSDLINMKHANCPAKDNNEWIIA